MQLTISTVWSRCALCHRDAGAEAGRWLTRAADIHAQLQGRRHPATKNARRLGGMEAEEDDTDEDDDGEANSEDAMDEENQLDGPDDATVGDYDNDAEDEDGEEDDDGEEDEINVDGEYSRWGQVGSTLRSQVLANSGSRGETGGGGGGPGGGGGGGGRLGRRAGCTVQ